MLIEKNLDKGISIGKLTEDVKSKALALIENTNDLNELKVDLVIEAIVERLDVKTKLVQGFAEINGAQNRIGNKYLFHSNNTDISSDSTSREGCRNTFL